jgi:anti-sigma B factor antagonist
MSTADSELLSSVMTTSGAVQVVRLRGELDLAAADNIKDALLMLSATTVVVDLEQLTFLDASGLSALLVARTGITATGRRFKIRGARGLVRRVFEVTDLAHPLED